MKVTISSLPGRSVSQSGRDNIFSRFSVSQSVSQPVIQSVRKSYVLSALALLVSFHFIDIWLSSYIFHLPFGRFFFISHSDIFVCVAGVFFFLYHTVIYSFGPLISYSSFFFFFISHSDIFVWALDLLLYHTVISSFVSLEYSFSFL